MISLKLVFLFFFCVMTCAHVIPPQVDAAVATVTSTPTPTEGLLSPTATLTQLKAQQTDLPFDLGTSLPSVPYTTAVATVPQNCLDYGVPTSTSPAECPVGNTMSAVSVTFVDCGSTFTVCRCENSSSMSYDDALTNFAKVPVGLRRYVGTVLLVPDSEPHAYTLTTGDIHMFSTTNMNTWIHEPAHAFDFGNTTTPYTASAEWSAAIQADSCVSDSYSQTNIREDFAQLSVVKLYALSNNGQLPPGFDNVCMKNQLAFMDSLPEFQAAKLFGNTCDINLSDETDGVTVGSGAKHTTPPIHIDVNLVSPFPNSNTTAASGFRKVPGGSNSVVSAGNDPSSSKQQSAATQISRQGSVAIGSAVVSILAILSL